MNMYAKRIFFLLHKNVMLMYLSILIKKSPSLKVVKKCKNETTIVQNKALKRILLPRFVSHIWLRRWWASRSVLDLFLIRSRSDQDLLLIRFRSYLVWTFLRTRNLRWRTARARNAEIVRHRYIDLYFLKIENNLL